MRYAPEVQKNKNQEKEKKDDKPKDEEVDVSELLDDEDE